jgi:flagellar protein FlaI
MLNVKEKIYRKKNTQTSENPELGKIKPQPLQNKKEEKKPEEFVRKAAEVTENISEIVKSDEVKHSSTILKDKKITTPRTLLKLEQKREVEKEILSEVEKEALETIEKARRINRIFRGRTSRKSRFGVKGKPIFEPYNPSVHGSLVEYTPPEGWEVVEEYWLYEHYNKIYIIYNEDENDYRYVVVEPALEDYEYEVFVVLKDLVKDILEEREISEGTIKEEVLKESIDFLIRDIKLPLDIKSYYKILYYIIRDYIFQERITPLMKDKKLEDISCNGYELPLFIYHKDYHNVETNVVFGEPEELDSFIISLAQQCGKHISIAEPMIDATMPDGSRIQMTLGKEVTDHGSTFTIRKFKEEPVTPIDLVAWGTFSAEQMAYLWLCIENKKSLIFAGGTASGKTTSTNAIALFIPRKSKIVTIEDTRELTLPHENWIPGVTRDAFLGEEGSIEMYDLLKAALRQRPEYIIVGEVRGKEALTLFQAMSTGHTTYSTLHADTVNGVIHRLENPPINVPRPMIEALDIISIQSQIYLKEKRIRRNIEIAEITDLNPHTKMLRTSTVFNYDSVKDKHAMIGTSKALEEIRKSRGWSQKELKKELVQRKRLLEYLADNDIISFKEVSSIIYTYQSNPEKALGLLDTMMNQ